MAKLKVEQVLKDLNNNVDMSLSMAKDVSNFKELRNGRYYPIAEKKKHLIVELSFLQLFIAWEQFLEETFIRYMCGCRTNSGFAPQLKITMRKPTLESALQIVNEGRDYADWSRWDDMIRKANTYFENGEPFADSIASYQEDLNEMKMIRNRIAHCSRNSKTKFENFVRQELGYVPTIRPGKLLSMKMNANITYFEHYGNLLKGLGRFIVK